jgi:hypothetical protein
MPRNLSLKSSPRRARAVTFSLTTDRGGAYYGGHGPDPKGGPCPIRSIGGVYATAAGSWKGELEGLEVPAASLFLWRCNQKWFQLLPTNL